MCRWRALLMLVIACAFVTPASGQTSVSLGAGASYIEYDGFLSTFAATFTPTLRVNARDISLGAQGSWTVFESGNQILQANAGAAWLSSTQSRMRLELSAAGGASKYAQAPAGGHLLARSRLHFAGERYGSWITAGGGVSIDSAGSTPLEAGVGVWTVQRRVALVGTVNAAWVANSRHIDVAFAARTTQGAAQLEARLGARPWARSPGFPGDAISGVWGEVSALVPLSRQVSLALSGGSYPSDPVRRVLGADYFTAGVHIMLSGSDYTASLALPDLETLLRRHRSNGTTADVSLEIAETSVEHVVRVHVANARTVELMGDFTNWEPLALHSAADNTWEVRLKLSRGVHRLNVRVDGAAWIVPAGVRSETDDFGGVVGILVVQ